MKPEPEAVRRVIRKFEGSPAHETLPSRDHAILNFSDHNESQTTVIGALRALDCEL